MEFRSLENISIERLLEVFNLSFSDYLVPFHLTKELLENKITAENIKPELSAGCFENNRLTGFILHGYDVVNGVKTAYNAGTGVVPQYRGNKITNRLYDFIIPILKKRGIRKVQLEVITQNKPAIHIYKSIGFETARSLNCYRGVVQVKNEYTAAGFTIRDLNIYDWELMQSFWDWTPSWQNAVSAVQHSQENNISKAIYRDDTLLGYVIYNRGTKKIQQFAVHKSYRSIGLGRLLFEYAAKDTDLEIVLLNVDQSAASTTKFLSALRLKTFITQYEMELVLQPHI